MGIAALQPSYRLVVGRKAQKLPLHRVDLGEIGRDEVIAAALAGHHLKAAVREGRGGTCAAEMDEGGEIGRASCRERV